MQSGRKSTDAQIGASVRYNKSQDNIMVRPSKEEGQAIRAAAAEAGQSVQGYVLQAVRARMESEGRAYTPPDGEKTRRKLKGVVPDPVRRRVGYLVWESDQERYAIMCQGEKYRIGVKCGETLTVNVAGQWVDSRIDTDGGEWYLVGTPYRGNLQNVQVLLPPESSDDS